MNIKQVKEKFTLQSLLSSLGHYPDKKKSKGHDLWYCSPFRPSEKTPSFHIGTSKDFYKDFGDTEKGGDLIWFAQMYLKHHGKDHSISNTLKWFDELDGGTNMHLFNKRAQKHIVKPSEKETPYRILSDKEIFSSVLIQYLDKKGLPLDLSKKYLRQIYFLNKNTKRKAFGLGFKTRAGGFDIRTANGFKTMIGNKDITIIKGTENTGVLEIFEGASDFLTTLAIENRDKPRFDTIVLNSANLYEQGAKYIEDKRYTHIRTWFDNDEAGRKFEAALLKKLSESKRELMVSRMNHVYDGFKDLNAWSTGSNISLSSKKNALMENSKTVKLNDGLGKLQA